MKANRDNDPATWFDVLMFAPVCLVILYCLAGIVWSLFGGVA